MKAIILDQSVTPVRWAPILAATLLACAGIAPNAGAADTLPPDLQTERPPYWPFTVAAEAGTTGFGGSLLWRFTDLLGARAGADYFCYSDYNFTPMHISYSGTARLLSEPLTLDIYPWKEHSYHLSVGVQFNENSLTASASRSGGEEGLDAKLTQQLVNPYLSIGGTFLYFDHAHHVGLGGELGVAYTGNPEISLTGPRANSVLPREQQNLKDWANRYKWWPVLKLMVTYSF